MHDVLDETNEQQHVAQEACDALSQHVVRHIAMSSTRGHNVSPLFVLLFTRSIPISSKCYICILWYVCAATSVLYE